MLPYNNNATLGPAEVPISLSMVHGEGPSHTQERQSIATPYDKWPCKHEKCPANDKQGNTLYKVTCAKIILLQLFM